MSDDSEDKLKALGETNSPTEDKAANPNPADIENRIAKCEGDIAALQAGANKANEEIICYAQDLRKYLRHTDWMRWGILIFSCVYIIIINILLGNLIFYQKPYFFILGTYTRVVFIFAAVSSSIGLFIAVLRGTLKSSAERHKENHTLSEIKTLAGIINQPNSH